MPSRAQIIASFDAIAEEFDASRPYPWRATIAFEPALPRGATVLDMGCGGGRNIAFLSERGHRVVGLDGSSRLLERAAARAGARLLVRGDLVSLPFAGASFSAVHCVATLHHLPSREERLASLREIVRVLRPGGPMLLTVWSHDQPRFASGPQDVEVPWHRADGQTVLRFCHLFRPGELEDLAALAGLAVTRSWREGDDIVTLATRN